MAYDLHDSKGFVGGGPNINGLRALKIELSHVSPAVYPQMAMFMTYGYATSPLRLKYEAAALSKQCKDPGVKNTLLEISKISAKADSIVILHNHVS
jgi:hypothetical protein